MIRGISAKRLLAITAAAALAVPVLADKILDTSITAFTGAGAPSTRQASFNTGFEVSDGLTAGDINGQAGWTVFTGDVSQAIMTANPASGTQHYRNQFEAGFSAGSNVGAFSPLFAAGADAAHTVSLDVAISATGGADYDVIPQAPSQGFLTARVKFYYQGDIYVLDDIGSGLAFIDTGTNWVPGAYKNLTIDIDPTGNTMDYYYDGALIYSSVSGVFAGTATEQVVLISDNWQAGETGDFDNLAVTPEPTSMLLMGLALTLLRRR